MLVRYYRDTNTTVVINLQQDHITYGIAQCSPSDQFSKRIGRELATQRCVSTPTILTQAQISNIVLDVIKSSRQPFAFKLEAFQRMLRYMTLEDFNTELLFVSAVYDYARNHS